MRGYPIKERGYTMNHLEELLGETISVKDLAEYLKIDIKTVRKYYLQLGGVRLGRSYRFFEKEVHNAIQAWHKMARTGVSEEREVQKKDLPDQKGSNRMGSGRTEKGGRPDSNRDPFGLLD